MCRCPPLHLMPSSPAPPLRFGTVVLVTPVAMLFLGLLVLLLFHVIRVLEILCHACQLGRHAHLPFATSNSRALNNFDLVHCDLWTSPVVSVSGYKYYLVILDDCSHFLWTCPLPLKFDTFTTISHFFSYVATQFDVTIKSIQCDNNREFDNSSARSFSLTCGVTVRMSCPHTSPHNG